MNDIDRLTLFDPFSPDFVANPHKYYQPILSAEAPVEIPIGLLLAKYDDVNHVLKAKDDFGRAFWPGMSMIHGTSIVDEYAYKILADWLIELNPPAHTRLRKPV